MARGPLGGIDPRRAVSLKLDARRFQGAVSRFLRGKGPEMVDKAVRKIAFDVTREIVVSLNGVSGLPKRIDTGRYRSGWAIGIERAIGNEALKAPLVRVDPNNPPKPTDGAGSIAGGLWNRVVTVINNVEYGPEIEDGTARMAAGMHRAAALAKVGRGIAQRIGPAFAAAWRT